MAENASELAPHAIVTPTDDEIVGAIWEAWMTSREEIGAFTTERLLYCIRFDHPTWDLDELRLEAVERAGVASGELVINNYLQNYVDAWKRGDTRPPHEYIQELEEEYKFDAAWRAVPRAKVGPMEGSFEVTSGEIAYGMLPSLVRGLHARALDAPGSKGTDLKGGTIKQRMINHRVKARNGTWKIAAVEGEGKPGHTSGYLAYHTAHAPLTLLSKSRHVAFSNRDAPQPVPAAAPYRVVFLNRYDWGQHAPEGQYARALADLDPEALRGAYGAKHALWLEGTRMNRYHPHAQVWSRFEDAFMMHVCFVVDAAHLPEVLKLIARPSQLDDRLEAKQNSSFYSQDAPRPHGDSVTSIGIDAAGESFGCQWSYPPDNMEYEVGRLIFDETEDTLVGFWYDGMHYDYEEDTLAKEPIIMDV